MLRLAAAFTRERRATRLVAVSSLPVLNVSAYLFTPLPDEAERTELRTCLLDLTAAADLRGTVLLAPEGINLFLAGAPASLRGFLDTLRDDPRFAGLRAKESWSATHPFGKTLVKLKNEIIRMDQPAIVPADRRAPAVAAGTVRRWLDAGHDDEGREVVMLDTRNAFEVDYGTFSGAVDWRIEKFTEFPAAALANRDQLAGKTVVSFCTGGIRCEKAAIYLEEQGFENVLQLEGGILTWFEEVGADHWDGECFVFDERESLRPDLSVRQAPSQREVKKHLR